MTTIVHDTYGKSAVRLMKVDRSGPQHRVDDVTVSIRLEGEFTAAHADGDNASVLPTDTMRNTVYAMGFEHALDPIEPFAVRLARHFIDNDASLSAATVETSAVRWEPFAGSAFQQA